MGSADQILTPLRYPPRQTPHPPHLETGIVKWLSMRKNGLSQEQEDTGVWGSPDLTQNPLRYPPRQSPHHPHLKSGIVKWLRKCTTWSLSGAGRDRGRGESLPNPDSTPLSSSPKS
jgi:hypothetical protein